MIGRAVGYGDVGAISATSCVYPRNILREKNCSWTTNKSGMVGPSLPPDGCCRFFAKLLVLRRLPWKISTTSTWIKHPGQPCFRPWSSTSGCHKLRSLPSRTLLPGEGGVTPSGSTSRGLCPSSFGANTRDGISSGWTLARAGFSFRFKLAMPRPPLCSGPTGSCSWVVLVPSSCSSFTQQMPMSGLVLS